MKILLTLIFLAFTPKVFAVANVFNPKLSSAENIILMVSTCEDGFRKAGPQYKESIRWSYCSCMIDAVMANPNVDEKSKPEMNFCLNRAIKLHGDSTR